jgi:cytochrome b561
VDFYAFNARRLHGLVAPALVLLVVLHVGAAFYHQFLLKDRLLARMWFEKKAPQTTQSVTEPSEQARM